MKPSEPEKFTSIALPFPMTQEDQARADFYALIARLFFAAPDMDLLAGLAQADSLSSQQPENQLDTAWEKLVMASSAMEAAAVREEFSDLFVSIGTPPINPYASFYLAGFMMEKPLAALRSDLSQLGLTRMEGKGELEDHLAALCETMRILIAGTDGMSRRPVQNQRAFFLKHIAPWYAHCLDDIRRHEKSNFYRHVADFAQAFLEIEFEAFELEDGHMNADELRCVHEGGQDER